MNLFQIHPPVFAMDRCQYVMSLLHCLISVGKCMAGHIFQLALQCGCEGCVGALAQIGKDLHLRVNVATGPGWLGWVRLGKGWIRLLRLG